MNKDIPIIIHLPHSSRLIPPEIRSELLIDDNTIKEELHRITDHYTDELYGSTNFNYIINKYSRMVFDPERFRDDSKETMAKYGLGAIYEKTYSGKPLRNLTDEIREHLLKKFYDPHHKSLEDQVQELLDIHDKCLIIDGHSFHSKSRFYKSEGLPSICIGTDNYHTPCDLKEYTFDFFSNKYNFDTKFNCPYSGTMVPLKFYGSDKRVSSIMLEINHSIYIDELTGEKSPSFNSLQNTIHKFLENVYIFYL